MQEKKELFESIELGIQEKLRHPGEQQPKSVAKAIKKSASKLSGKLTKIFKKIDRKTKKAQKKAVRKKEAVPVPIAGAEVPVLIKN